ncbi:MAG: hypothetical protein LBT54_07545, partial [Bifidobacteriaceae bacterium]|nr:hypothetical protein [Bifidobacteriaceae bacterium]
YQFYDPGQGFYCHFGADDRDVVIVEVYEHGASVAQKLSDYDGGAIMDRRLVYGENWYALGIPEQLTGLVQSGLALEGPTTELRPAEPLGRRDAELLDCQRLVSSLIPVGLEDPERLSEDTRELEKRFPDLGEFLEPILAPGNFSPSGGDEFFYFDMQYELEAVEFGRDIRDYCRRVVEGG